MCIISEFAGCCNAGMASWVFSYYYLEHAIPLFMILKRRASYLQMRQFERASSEKSGTNTDSLPLSPVRVHCRVSSLSVSIPCCYLSWGVIRGGARLSLNRAKLSSRKMKLGRFVFPELRPFFFGSEVCLLGRHCRPFIHVKVHSNSFDRRRRCCVNLGNEFEFAFEIASCLQAIFYPTLAIELAGVAIILAY